MYDRETLLRMQGQKNAKMVLSLHFKLRAFLLLSSIISGACQGAMVCTAKILMQTLGKYEGKMMYHDWITYAAATLFVLLYITDIVVMNRSVSMYSQLHVIPF